MRSCVMGHVKIRVRDARSHVQVVVHNAQKRVLRIVRLHVMNDALQDALFHVLGQKKLLWQQLKFKLEVINYVRLY